MTTDQGMDAGAPSWQELKAAHDKALTAAKYWQQKADSNADDVISLLNLLADIRTAAGDPEGMLMQPELVAHIREQRQVLQQIRTDMRRTGGGIDTRTLGRLQAVIVAAGGGS